MPVMVVRLRDLLVLNTRAGRGVQALGSRLRGSLVCGPGNACRNSRTLSMIDWAVATQANGVAWHPFELAKRLSRG